MRGKERGEMVRVRRTPEGDYVCPPDETPMVLVPAGEVFLGRDVGDLFAADDELPGRTVRLRAFLIDRAPVTNAQFAQFMREDGYRRAEFWDAEGWHWLQRSGVQRPLSFETPGFSSPLQPVAGVSWYEAAAYARWAGKQLPTEAQWERAARGDDRRLFPWGDALPRSAFCNFDGRIGRTTVPGAYPCGHSPFGLYDMAGNVNNWCRDWYWAGFYRWCAENGVRSDPCLDDALRRRIAPTTRQRVDRGGGFATSFGAWHVLSVTGRLGWPPEHRALWHGFRCVVEIEALD